MKLLWVMSKANGLGETNMNTKEEDEYLDPIHIPWRWQLNTLLVQQPPLRSDFVFTGLQLTAAEKAWIIDHGIHKIPEQWGLRKPPLTSHDRRDDLQVFRSCGFREPTWGLDQVCFETNWRDLHTDMLRLFVPAMGGLSMFAAAALVLFHYSILYMNFPMARVFDPSDVASQIRSLFENINLEKVLPDTLRGVMERFVPIVDSTAQLRDMTTTLHQLIIYSPERARQFLKARQMLTECELRPHSAAFFTMLVAMDTLLRLAVPGTHGQAAAQWAAFANALEKYMAQKENELDDAHDYWEIDVSDPLHPVVVSSEDICSPSSTSASSGAYSSEYSPSQTNTPVHPPLIDSIQIL